MVILKGRLMEDTLAYCFTQGKILLHMAARVGKNLHSDVVQACTTDKLT